MSDESINVKHRKGKVNSFGDLALSMIPTKHVCAFYRKARNQGSISESYINSEGNALQALTDGRVVLDYEIGKKTTIGILMSGFNSRLTTK